MEEEQNKSEMDGEIDEKKVEEWFKKKFSGECCKDNKCGSSKKHKMHKMHKAGAGAGLYCLGLIGAAIYFIGTATTFWIGVLGFFESTRLASFRSLWNTPVLRTVKIKIS